MAGFAYAIAAAVTWGLVYTIDQKIVNGLSPFGLLFVDSVLGAILMLPLVFFFENGDILKNILVGGKTNFWLILLSLILAMGANFFIFSGIKLLGASNASVIEIAYPFFVALFGILLFGSSPSLAFYIGGALVFIGSAIIIYFH